MLDVDIPNIEDIKCRFCEEDFPENVEEHMNTCNYRTQYTEYEIKIKLLERDLDRLQYQHTEVFSKLLLNEPIPVKQTLIDFCITCPSYEEHERRECLKMSRVDAFDIITRKMQLEEMLIKYEYIDIKVKEMIAQSDDRAQRDRKTAEERIQHEHKSLNPTHMTSREWRCAKRNKFKELTRSAYLEQRDKRKGYKKAMGVKARNQVAITVCLEKEVNRSRDLLLNLENFMTPDILNRFVSTHDEMARTEERI